MDKFEEKSEQFTELFHEHYFDALRKRHIGGDGGYEPEEIAERQYGHVEIFAQRRERQRRTDQNGQAGQKEHRCRSAALNERDFSGADHVDDQRLRP